MGEAARLAEFAVDFAAILPVDLPVCFVAFPVDLPAGLVAVLPVVLPADFVAVLPVVLPADFVAVLPVDLPDLIAILPVDLPDFFGVFPADLFAGFVFAVARAAGFVARLPGDFPARLLVRFAVDLAVGFVALDVFLFAILAPFGVWARGFHGCLTECAMEQNRGYNSTAAGEK